MKALKRLQTGLQDRAHAFCEDESGASAVEYGLLASLIAAAIILTVTQLGNRMKGVFQTVTNAMTN